MFDNLRESAESPFYEEESNDLYKEPASRPMISSGQFSGVIVVSSG